MDIKRKALEIISDKTNLKYKIIGLVSAIAIISVFISSFLSVVFLVSAIGLAVFFGCKQMEKDRKIDARYGNVGAYYKSKLLRK